jgi:cytochrome c553
MNDRRIYLSAALTGVGIVCALGCGHAREATPPTAAVTNEEAPAQPQQPQSKEPEKVHEASTEKLADYDAAPLADEEPPPLFADSIQTFMLEHFVIATWARDSVIDGDIEGLRMPLDALADYSYRSVAPGGWMRGIAQLQAAARLTADANTLEAAARGVAAMGRVCGECHREQGGPDVKHYKPERKGPKSDSYEARMFRHAWAVERLWEGLTSPSDEAWVAGAAALSHAPSAAPTAEPALPPTVVQKLTLVRQLGSKAARADSFEAREKVYGELLVTCAHCHSSAPAER